LNSQQRMKILLSCALCPPYTIYTVQFIFIWMYASRNNHPSRSVFYLYNIYNNYIINNKSDEIKILKTRMAARHWQ
jgi:hypothetical protein